MLVSNGLLIYVVDQCIKYIYFNKNRVKLHHFQSAHDQLFEVDSQQLITFERKYGLCGPVPEGLTNYLDVRNKNILYVDKDYLF